MIRLKARALGACALLALAGCGKGGADKAQVLHVYNWTDYIEPSILTDFTKETGIKVVYDTFDSNEVLETKLLTASTGYDVVVPSNHNIQRYVQAKALAPLDFAQLPNRKNLWPELMQRMEPFDPGGQYSVPYMWGTIGIGYNVEAVKKRISNAPTDSWKLVFDPAYVSKLQDCGVYFLDASEDMFAVALKAMGKDPNSANPADIAAAAAMMGKVRPYVRKFSSSEYLEALANGDVCVAIGYSGDVLQARTRAEEAKKGVEIAYAIPKEGSQVWFDVLSVPVDAPNPAAAHKFIDYLLRPEVIAKASNYVAYANANQAATPLLDAAVRDDPNVYPPPEVFERLFVTTAKPPELAREVNRAWTQVTTGQ